MIGHVDGAKCLGLSPELSLDDGYLCMDSGLLQRSDADLEGEASLVDRRRPVGIGHVEIGAGKGSERGYHRARVVRQVRVVESPIAVMLSGGELASMQRYDAANAMRLGCEFRRSGLTGRLLLCKRLKTEQVRRKELVDRVQFTAPKQMPARG